MKTLYHEVHSVNLRDIEITSWAYAIFWDLTQNGLDAVLMYRRAFQEDGWIDVHGC